jgi:hypothetical protein
MRIDSVMGGYCVPDAGSLAKRFCALYQRSRKQETGQDKDSETALVNEGATCHAD